jgi:hypothetical protein
VRNQGQGATRTLLLVVSLANHVATGDASQPPFDPRVKPEGKQGQGGGVWTSVGYEPEGKQAAARLQTR